MKKKIVLGFLFYMGTLVFLFADDLNFIGWSNWGGLQLTVQGNSVTLNGRVAIAGIFADGLNTSLRGNTVTLAVQNAGNSVFNMERMIKITVNKEDRIIHPDNVTTLILREYVPSGYSTITFTLPNDFDGKLQFVFYEADLRNLQITATYR